MGRFRVLSILASLLVLVTPSAACGASTVDGGPSLLWTFPFVGILLSIALFPLLKPAFWHHHFGKVSAFWALLYLIPSTIAHGFFATLDHALHVYVLEFIPFLILLWALYTTAGGIRMKGRLRGSPGVNLAILLFGTVLASWMGTTGAAMLLIRPLIRANAWRQKKTHLVVFFIFLVANIGGCLTPLGDPPLFLGFLYGVSFFWTLEHMALPLLICAAPLAAMFYVVDRHLLSKEPSTTPPDDGVTEALGLEGSVNFLFIAGIVAAIFYSGSSVRNPTYFDQAEFERGRSAIEAATKEVTRLEAEVEALAIDRRPAKVREVLAARVVANGHREESLHHATRGLHVSEHVTWPYLNLVRDGFLVLMGVLSLVFTSRDLRRRNEFTWFPIIEVAKLFAGIFVTIIPAIEILKRGPDGALSSVVMAVTDGRGGPVNVMYFALTGILSSFLDNAPTYLVFFNTAGGNAEFLMGTGASTLTAISAGAVFMGAMTYIGNAPNFMVRSIAEESGIKMPSFFGYVGRWSVPILVPVFVVLAISRFL